MRRLPGFVLGTALWCRTAIPVSFSPVHAPADRQRATHGGRPRALAAGLAVTVALMTAGCSDAGNGGGGGGVSQSNGAPLVTGEQVVTACFQQYFYNGVLPKASARANCTSCVVDHLRRLGIQPSSGENVTDMLTGDRLSSSNIAMLENYCNEADASSQ